MPRLNPVATVHPNDNLILYAAGLGPTDDSGRVMDPVDVYLGERKAKVLSATLAPGLSGVYQLNVVAPALATDRIYLRSGGWQSNVVYMGAQTGSNALNVVGSIDGVYPSNDPNYPRVSCTGYPFAGCGSESFSIMLHAGTFSFDIAPKAAAFDVAAVGEAGNAIVSINPAAGTYTALVATVTELARVGDFHDSVVPLWNYVSCDSTAAVCLPFPGPGIIPVSRFSPLWFRALQGLPQPNTTGTAPNTLTQTAGTFSGSHFAIDAQHNSALSTFGGIVQIPYAPFDRLGSTFTLYVDGVAIVAKSLPCVPVYRCIAVGPLCWSAPGAVIFPPQLIADF